MQRVALLNGKNINQDYDLSKIFSSIATSGVVEGLDVQSGKVTPGYAFIEIERNGVIFNVLFQNTADLTIDTSGTKKVYIEINQENIDDGSSNLSDGTGIGEIKTGASYPISNYLALGSIVSGVITDERVFISLKNNKVSGDLNFIGGEPKIDGAGLNEANGLVQLGGDGKINGDLLNTPIVQVQSTQSTFVAGENITASNYLCVKRYMNSLGVTYLNSDSLYSGSTIYRGKNFLSPVAQTVNSVVFDLKKTGSPTGNATCKIYATSGGLPTGVALATSNNFDVSTLTTSRSNTTITFASPFSMSANTQYAFILNYSGGSVGNTVDISQGSTGLDTYESPSSTDGSSWGSGGTVLAKLNTTAGVYGYYFKTDASDTSKLDVKGIATNSISIGGNIIVDTDGSSNTQTGLIPGSIYYLSNTPGAISLIPGTNVVSVGTAMTTTSIKMNTDDKYSRDTYLLKTDSLLFTRDLSASAETVVVNHNLGKIPKMIKFSAYLSSSGATNSLGVSDGTVNECIYALNASTSNQQTSYCIYIQTNTSTYQRATITNLTSTSFSVVWTKNLSPTGTIYILAELFG